MPDYLGLKSEIAKPVYLGMTDDQIASVLTTSTIEIPINLGVGDAEGYLRLNTRITALEDWVAANSTPSVARSAARELLGLLSGKVSTLQTGDPATRTVLEGMFSVLVSASAGGITQADSDALFGMASKTVTIAEQYAFGSNSDLVQEIAAARLV